ncbi:GvpL/GvpF family gas vesicle protein [Terrabacter lapilli]|uniref:GvpL/GvpF family gas vesicle protein n=1 Tax=Terrabacter lapilli TaxID=436231 RepID=A0ABN2SAG2_9MICO
MRTSSAVPASRGTSSEGELFLYGILPAKDLDAGTAAAVELRGLDGRPVEFVRSGDLATAVTLVDLDRRPGRRADLLAYQSVLDGLAGIGPVAPVRFGSVMPDADTVVDELMTPDADYFVALLERLRGRRQFNLRVTPVEEAALAELVAADPEIRRLRELTRGLPEEASYRDRVRLGELVAHGLEQQSAQDADMVLDLVAPLADDHLVRGAPSPTEVVDVALLVDDDRSDELVDALEQYAEAWHPRLRLRLVGPLAPYDFVEEGSWA